MHPILFKIGPIQLYTYGAMLAVAFVVGIWLAMRTAKQEGVEPEFIADLGIVVILSSILGARLFYILFYAFRYTLAHPRELFRLQQTGLVFYGGLILAVVAGVIFGWKKGVSVPIGLDIAAPSIALGQAIGRLGCFMSGCCYGKPTLVAWGVHFPHLDYLRHPTQIYESLATFAIFLVLIRFQKRKTAAGQTAWLYAVLYASARFALEFFRGDNAQVFLGLTVSQILSLIALLGILPIGYFLWFQSRGERSLSTAGGGPKGEKQR